MNNIVTLIFLFLMSCQSTENKTQLQTDSLPIGNNYLLSFPFYQSEWLDDVEIDSLGFVVEAFDPEESKLSNKYFNLSHQLYDTSFFYKTLKDSTVYLQQGLTSSPYYLVATNEMYSLYYTEVYLKNSNHKVHADSINIGYLITMNSKNDLIDAIQVNAEVEYNATDEYLGAMYVQNQKTFFLSKQSTLWVYDFIRKLNPINTEYSLLRKKQYYISNKGLFIMK